MILTFSLVTIKRYGARSFPEKDIKAICRVKSPCHVVVVFPVFFIPFFEETMPFHRFFIGFSCFFPCFLPALLSTSEPLARHVALSSSRTAAGCGPTASKSSWGPAVFGNDLKAKTTEDKWREWYIILWYNNDNIMIIRYIFNKPIIYI